MLEIIGFRKRPQTAFLLKLLYQMYVPAIRVGHSARLLPLFIKMGLILSALPITDTIPNNFRIILE